MNINSIIRIKKGEPGQQSPAGENMKEIKVEWCENFIKATFAKLPSGITGIYSGCFWKMAEKAGLYEPGTFG